PQGGSGPSFPICLIDLYRVHLIDAVHGFHYDPPGFLVLLPGLNQAGADVPVTGIPPPVIPAVEQDTAILHFRLADASQILSVLRACLGHALLIGDPDDLIHTAASLL